MLLETVPVDTFKFLEFSNDMFGTRICEVDTNVTQCRIANNARQKSSKDMKLFKSNFYVVYEYVTYVPCSMCVCVCVIERDGDNYTR
jgi:hypothetical protein